MHRYVWPAVLALVAVLVIWVGLAIIGASRDPRDLPQEPPATRLGTQVIAAVPSQTP